MRRDWGGFGIRVSANHVMKFRGNHLESEAEIETGPVVNQGRYSEAEQLEIQD
jgi:hypothetical protein